MNDTNRNTLSKLPLSKNATGRTLVLVTFALLALGSVMVFSAVASVKVPGRWYSRVDVRHVLFATVAACVLIFSWRIDYRLLLGKGRWPVLATIILILALILGVLVFIPPFAYPRSGIYRWIRLGPKAYSIGFQPSEFIKLAMVIFLSAYLTRDGVSASKFKWTFLLASGVIALCVGLVIKEDFGTGLLIAIAGMVTLLLAGAKLWQLTLPLPLIGMAGYFLVFTNAKRWERIQAMLDPWATDNPSAFQPKQSLIAILEGGWWGKGPGNSIQKLGYLPEDTTDFVFSVYCEEWGFVGAMMLMTLVLMWIWCARRSAMTAATRFGMVLAGSLGFMLALQAILHIAVNIVVAPPTGMAMPFISAGGTSLLISCASAALIVSITSRVDTEKK